MLVMMSTKLKSITDEINQNCLLTRTRQISRIITGIYDQELRPFGINSPQFSLLVIVARLGPTSRAEIGRANHQERSTLTRNLQLLLSEGWIEEVQNDIGGRARPMVLTKAGKALLEKAAPAWRNAQEKAKSVLGRDGVTSFMHVAAAISQHAS